MGKAILGNHSAFRMRRAERHKSRKFYRDVSGCTTTREFDDKDDFRIGDGSYIACPCDSGR
jgi:hypothetical protein